MGTQARNRIVWGLYVGIYTIKNQETFPLYIKSPLSLSRRLNKNLCGGSKINKSYFYCIYMIEYSLSIYSELLKHFLLGFSEMSSMDIFFIPEAKVEEEAGSSTSIMSDSMVMNTPDGPLNNKMSGPGQIEVDFAKCDCCGLTEECTLSYIETIRARYQGKWICGLCAEAVKDEIFRCQKLISPDEAMARHFNFCNKFRSSGPPEDPTAHLISAMRQILRKSLESPKSLRSMPSSPMKSRGDGNTKGNGLTRSESCIPSLSLVESPALRGMGEGCEL